MNNVTSLQLIIGREDENEYIEIDLNEYNEKYKQLKSRIDKAIEYIKHYGNLYCLKNKQFKDYEQYKELLDILKGSDKE